MTVDCVCQQVHFSSGSGNMVKLSQIIVKLRRGQWSNVKPVARNVIPCENHFSEWGSNLSVKCHLQCRILRLIKRFIYDNPCRRNHNRVWIESLVDVVDEFHCAGFASRELPEDWIAAGPPWAANIVPVAAWLHVDMRETLCQYKTVCYKTVVHVWTGGSWTQIFVTNSNLALRIGLNVTGWSCFRAGAGIFRSFIDGKQCPSCFWLRIQDCESWKIYNLESSLHWKYVERAMATEGGRYGLAHKRHADTSSLFKLFIDCSPATFVLTLKLMLTDENVCTSST